MFMLRNKNSVCRVKMKSYCRDERTKTLRENEQGLELNAGRNNKKLFVSNLFWPWMRAPCCALGHQLQTKCNCFHHTAQNGRREKCLGCECFALRKRPVCTLCVLGPVQTSFSIKEDKSRHRKGSRLFLVVGLHFRLHSLSRDFSLSPQVT